MLRKPGLINGALIIGLLLGPGIGALAHALLAMAAHGGQISLMPTLITNAGAGYVLALPVFLPVMLALRHWRRDSLLFCAAIGFLLGVLVFYAALGVIGSGWAPVVFQGGLPFGLMLLAIRLIAGRRI
ncbi:MAG: hypothetical protein AB7P20_20545 [Rhizobiaceae bacterium]